jgi:hypothetical protein
MKIPCVECKRGAKASPTRYVCAGEHRQVVHRTCIALFRRCGIEDCQEKIIAVEKSEQTGPPSPTAKAYYKRVHTLKKKAKFWGTLDFPKVESRLEGMGLLESWCKSNGVYHRRKDGVTKEQLEKARAEVNEEIRIAWLEEKKRINRWFT